MGKCSLKKDLHPNSACFTCVSYGAYWFLPDLLLVIILNLASVICLPVSKALLVKQDCAAGL